MLFVTPSLNFWQRTHESILCCSKEKPHFNRDDVREPYTDGYLKNAAGKIRKPTKGRFSNGTKETVYTAHANGALPRDVIKISALAGGAGKKERVNHPTQKPLEVILWCLNITDSLKNIFDPFLGSGSTLIACEKTNRICYGMELDTKYCDVIIERWEQFTGQKANKITE